MLQEYHWIIFLIALIVPGGLLALGTYHLLKLGLQARLQRQTEAGYLEDICVEAIYDDVIYLDNKE